MGSNEQTAKLKAARLVAFSPIDDWWAADSRQTFNCRNG